MVVAGQKGYGIGDVGKGKSSPGVPWTQHLNEPKIALALKSGNFGNEDFFLDAFNKLNKL